MPHACRFPRKKRKEKRCQKVTFSTNRRSTKTSYKWTPTQSVRAEITTPSKERTKQTKQPLSRRIYRITSFSGIDLDGCCLLGLKQWDLALHARFVHHDSFVFVKCQTNCTKITIMMKGATLF